MKNYLCLQRHLPTDRAPEKPSPAQMQEMYARFTAWQEQFKANLVDMGGRLGAGRVVTAEPTDGPLVEIKELVGGYMIVAANTFDDAVDIARQCPGLVSAGSGVEVIEIRSS